MNIRFFCPNSMSVIEIKTYISLALILRWQWAPARGSITCHPSCTAELSFFAALLIAETIFGPLASILARME
jgi:hypothetical protein